MSKFSTPVSYGFIVALYGLLGIPTSLFVIVLTFDRVAWITGLKATGYHELFFIWSAVTFVMSCYLFIGGLRMLKNTDTSANL